MTQHNLPGIELEENVPLQPKGWDFGEETKYPFEHLTDPSKSFFVKLEEHETATPEELKKLEGTLRRKIYARATFGDHSIDVRRGLNGEGHKGLRVFQRRTPKTKKSEQ